MIKIISQWFENTFSNRQAAILIWMLILIAAIVYFFGDILAPVIAAIVITYLLNSIVNKLNKHINRKLAVSIVFTWFIIFIATFLILILPLIIRQLSQFIGNIPSYVLLLQSELSIFMNQYPDIFSRDVLQMVSADMASSISAIGKVTLSKAFSILPNIIEALIYLILVPMLTLFLLKDHKKVVKWFEGFLPKDHSLANQVWLSVDQQLGNYIRGKFIEIILVGITTYIGFAVFSLEYAVMLATLVGLSVIIPYVGVTIISIPVFLVSYTQFGMSQELLYVLLVYLVIQALDGYVLVPTLFAEAVNMHPIAIVISILCFGGFWGFWGLFFAIPLGVLVQSVILAWPRKTRI